jgi:hypothetical protein
MKYRRSILENSAKRFSLTEALYLNAESRRVCVVVSNFFRTFILSRWLFDLDLQVFKLLLLALPD